MLWFSAVTGGWSRSLAHRKLTRYGRVPNRQLDYFHVIAFVICHTLGGYLNVPLSVFQTTIPNGIWERKQQNWNSADTVQ